MLFVGLEFTSHRTIFLCLIICYLDYVIVFTVGLGIYFEESLKMKSV